MRTPEFWIGQSRLAGLMRRALAPASSLYAATVAYKVRHARPYRSTSKVVCVGNLTAGGTGKTPIAIALARMLVERDERPYFLTRGYGGREHGPLLVDPLQHCASDVGDEALLLAAAAPTIVARDRVAGARLAEAEGADVIIMDDGHQNFSLAKDLSLVVIDSEQGFGNGKVLPAGPLREPIQQGLARADAIVSVGKPFVFRFRKPVLHARLVTHEDANLLGERVIAFAGIGRPQKFFQTLRQVGASVVATHAFADHHVYARSDLKRLHIQSKKTQARLITTEKDFLRLSPEQREGIRHLPVHAEFDDPAALLALLDGVVPPGGKCA